MKPLDLATLRAAVREGRLEWRKHVLQKLAERSISQDTVVRVLLEGERIRDYSGDRPFPSALFLGYTGSKPFHVVAACDDANSRVFIITAYEPRLDVFESDYRTRKK
jgi:hypothetical protein